MATFERLNDPRQYMAAMREIDKARDCGYAIDIVKHREVATNKQMAYLNFIISYTDISRARLSTVCYGRYSKMCVRISS